MPGESRTTEKAKTFALQYTRHGNVGVRISHSRFDNGKSMIRAVFRRDCGDLFMEQDISLAIEHGELVDLIEAAAYAHGKIKELQPPDFRSSRAFDDVPFDQLQRSDGWHDDTDVGYPEWVEVSGNDRVGVVAIADTAPNIPPSPRKVSPAEVGVASAILDDLDRSKIVPEASQNHQPIDVADMLKSFAIRVTRRDATGCRVRGKIAGHRFTAFVHHEEPPAGVCQMGVSRITKLDLRSEAGEVATFDAGWKLNPTTDLGIGSK